MESKMDRSVRAKQFMPFDALRGFREALADKERIIVPRVELSEDARDVLDYKLSQVEKNSIITIIYYDDGEYLKLTGMVSRLDMTAGILKIVYTKIQFKDIYDIQGENIDMQ